MLNKEKKEAFPFNLEFQFAILHFIINDRNGPKALALIEDYYFALLDHQVIGFALKRYYRKHKNIPKERAVFKEELINIFKLREYANLFSDEDKKRLFQICDDLYKGVVKDGDELFAACIQFARYTQLKSVSEGLNLMDFDQYEDYIKRVRKAISTGEEYKTTSGVHLIKGAKMRHHERLNTDTIIPTPFWQINRLTNAGGYEKGSIIVILDKEKQFKTAQLLNIARGYMRQKKNIYYVDLENGEKALTTRLEQSLIRKTKKEILSGEFDAPLQKLYRKYARIGVEVRIKRFPTGTTCDQLQREFDNEYNLYGTRFGILIVDYAALMGSNDGKKEDEPRISQVYLDLKNFAIVNDLDIVWTANHVTRAAFKKMHTRYESGDTAKCIDIARHVDALFGLNRSEDEIENNIMRMELVEQRDGYPEGRAYFMVNADHQRSDEFTHEQVKELLNQSERSKDL